MLPFGILPAWTYHAQVPPPDHKFNPAIPGITWVDLVFPFFLFSMGAAIPMALESRLVRGEKLGQAVWGLLWRFLVLAGFAIYLQNTRPPMPKTTPEEWGVSLTAMALLFPVLLRYPATWPKWIVPTVRGLGLVGIAVFLWQFRNRQGQPFNPETNDIILLVLANVALVGGLIYLLTRTKPTWRWAFVAVWTAVVIARLEPGWVKDLFAWREPIKWVYNAEFLKYLLLVVPGTFVGEAILRAARETPNEALAEHDEETPAPTRWPVGVQAVVAALAFGIVPLLTHLLFVREVAWAVAVGVLMGGALLALTHQANSAFERLIRTLCQIGVLLLLVGLAFEPFQGGIKKDSATLSYFSLTGGLASLLLASLSQMIDAWRFRGWGWCIAVGQNPILAYLFITHLMPWIWKGLGVEMAFVERFGVEPGPGAMRGIAEALLLMAIVALCTRLKIVFRA